MSPQDHYPKVLGSDKRDHLAIILNVKVFELFPIPVVISDPVSANSASEAPKLYEPVNYIEPEASVERPKA